MTAEPARISQLAGLAPAFLVRFVEGLRAARARGLNVAPFETLRTEERQAWLYAQGRSRPGTRVTNASSARLTYHGWGLAADVAFLTPGGDFWWPSDRTTWVKLADVMRGVGLVCGLDWSGFEDDPHFQAAGTPNTMDSRLAALWPNKLAAWQLFDQLNVEYYDQHGWR